MYAILSARARLALSLQDLLRCNPITDITVGDIIENAGLSNRSFYNYFKDKYDLLGYSYRQATENLWYVDGKKCSLLQFFKQCEAYLSVPENLKSFGHALSYYGQNDLRFEIENKGVEDLIRLLRWNFFPGEITAEHEEILHFFMCGISRFCELHYINSQAVDADWLFSFWINCLPQHLAIYLTKDPEAGA